MFKRIAITTAAIAATVITAAPALAAVGATPAAYTSTTFAATASA